MRACVRACVCVRDFLIIIFRAELDINCAFLSGLIGGWAGSHEPCTTMFVDSVLTAC